MSPSDAPSTVALRPVVDADTDLLRRIYRDTRDDVAALPWADAQKDEFVDAQFRAQAADYAQRFAAAEHSIVLVDDRPVGRIWVDRRPDEIRLLDVALLAAHRNRGTGSELIGRLIAEAGRAGVPLRHSVFVDNADALRFYRRLGFVVIEDFGMYVLMELAPVTPEAPLSSAG
ncbi:MAG: GNAT family N-acetyltransferase [Ilumatobacter sp.]|nr:GNAT family N-acetyltransferase [Ilumatobacter sp.]